MQINTLILKYGNQKFGYNSKKNEIDCIQFAFNIVRDLTGIDYYKKHRHKYTNKKEAYKYMKTVGYNDLIETVTNLVKKEKTSPLEAKSGDIVAGKTIKQEIMLGICYKNNGVFKGMEQKIFFIPLKNCTCSWRIV